MNIIQITPTVANPRFTFDRSIELSKYINVTWLLGWTVIDDTSLSRYVRTSHKIHKLGKSRTKGTKVLGLWNEFIFVLLCIKHIKNSRDALIIVHSHHLAFLYPILCPRCNYVLQLYTTSVSPSAFKRSFHDAWRRIVIFPYDKVLIGTAKMIDMMKISKKKCFQTRWGMHPVSITDKSFENNINLLYIGSLNGRRIHDTIQGLHLFLRKNPNAIVRYSIIGKGSYETVDVLKQTISDCKLENVVKMYGYLPDTEIRDFFDCHNIGISFVPITQYYDDVVATKTVEYLVSGLAVIATDTRENRKMISDANGVLIDDTPQAFAEGMERIIGRFSSFASKEIRESSNEWLLENNVKNLIVPLYRRFASEFNENINKGKTK